MATREITLHKYSEIPETGQISETTLQGNYSNPQPNKRITETSYNFLPAFIGQLRFEIQQLLRTPVFLIMTLALVAFLPLLKKLGIQGDGAIESMVSICGLTLFTVVIDRLGKRVGDRGHCTGVRSTILHQPGIDTYGEIALPFKQWSFLILNHTGVNSPIGDNSVYCQDLKSDRYSDNLAKATTQNRSQFSELEGIDIIREEVWKFLEQGVDINRIALSLPGAKKNRLFSLAMFLER